MDRQLEWYWAPSQCQKAAKPPLLTKRRTVKIRTYNPSAGLHDWTIKALKAVARRHRYGLPRIYQLGRLLSRVRAAAPGAAARIETLGEDSLRLMLSEVCNFDDIRLNAKGKDTHRIVPPPREILQSILAMDKLDRAAFRRWSCLPRPPSWAQTAGSSASPDTTAATRFSYRPRSRFRRSRQSRPNKTLIRLSI